MGLLSALHTIHYSQWANQPADPNAAKPKPNTIPRDSKILMTNIQAFICRPLDRLLIGLETSVEALIQIEVA